MCYSFNEAANRDAFVADEDAYCASCALNVQQREAIRNRNVLQLIEAGGNAYYLAKFAGIFGLDMQDIGAQQTGMTKDEFTAKLLAVRGRIMATIVGAITTSHVPAIGRAIAKGLQNDPYSKPFFDGFPPVRDWLAKVEPDVIVLVYNPATRPGRRSIRPTNSSSWRARRASSCSTGSSHAARCLKTSARRTRTTTSRSRTPPRG